MLIASANDKDTDFDHCISEDIGDDRYTRVGVAVVFSKLFCKPLESDITNLTCQKIPNSSTMYGLVTKSKYNGKPTIKDHQTVFDLLIIVFTLDFFHLKSSSMA